ncbi:MAG: type II toxin-antitoxin system VapB family antitoxin [Nitrospirae bacterium]|nr:type II toxin-antitoxin system VapB family antitoxin [Nitrospirota bacterium]
MRTTLDIPEDLIKEAMKLSKSKTKKDSIIIAIEDFIKKKRVEKAISMEGRLKFKKEWERLRHER